jgi:dolichol-phosphate mannosyltransferase
MSPRVCIVIPMYNESAIAQRSMETVLRYTKAFPKTTVLIVDDGSDDATEEIVRTHIEKDSSNQLVLVRHDMNQGYGAALKTGMRYTIDEGYDYAVFMDSDLTNHPKYLSGFYDAMSRGTQYIKATRYDGRGGMQGVPWQRQIMSRAGNGIARALYRLPISDPTNGFRAVHRSILQNPGATAYEIVCRCAIYVNQSGE